MTSITIENCRSAQWKARLASTEAESHFAEVSSIQNWMTVKKRSGLSSEKRVSRVPAGKASPKATGLITAMLVRLVRLQQVAGNDRLKSIRSCTY